MTEKTTKTNEYLSKKLFFFEFLTLAYKLDVVLRLMSEIKS